MIRKAERQDVPLLLEFIRDIARFGRMEDEVIASPEVLEREMFDEHRAEAVFAVADGREVGFALYFYNFSTFIGHSGLYLEDLFVWPEERGKSYGKALLLHLVKTAREHHCGLMGGFFGMQGPPAVLYFIQSEPTKEHYMAMAQTYFLIGNAMMTLVRAYNGFFTTPVLTDYCFGLGGVIIGTSLGAYVFKRIPNRAFRYVVYAYIGVSGMIIMLTNG